MRKKQKYKYVTLFINRANLIDLNVINVLLLYFSHVLQNWDLKEKNDAYSSSKILCIAEFLYKYVSKQNGLWKGLLIK